MAFFVMVGNECVLLLAVALIGPIVRVHLVGVIIVRRLMCRVVWVALIGMVIHL